MTAEGLKGMFKGNFADNCAEKFMMMLMGGQGTVKGAQMVSENPHQPERRLVRFILWHSREVHNAPTSVMNKQPS